jgi:hypothetical protein
MKKILLAATLIFHCLPYYAQQITGKVLDASTNKPLPMVNVFLNSTTMGTYSDEIGHFILKIPSGEKLPVAFSAIGYNSLLLSEYSVDAPLEISLTPKIYPLAEVIVSSKRSARERTTREKRLSLFRKQFLGETMNAKSCEIMNEKELIFQYLADGDILRAYSLNPLIINNKSLGYQILYYLDTFEYSPSMGSLQIYGNHIFRDDPSLNNSKREKAEKRRRSAYLGSRMHFFRSLWDNDLDSAGYTIKDEANALLNLDSLVIRVDSVSKYLKNRDVLYISYFSKSSTSSISFIQDSIFFTKFGYFDPYGISWRGEMSKQRIGDLLPYDYLPENKKQIKRK